MEYSSLTVKSQDESFQNLESGDFDYSCLQIIQEQRRTVDEDCRKDFSKKEFQMQIHDLKAQLKAFNNLLKESQQIRAKSKKELREIQRSMSDLTKREYFARSELIKLESELVSTKYWLREEEAEKVEIDMLCHFLCVKVKCEGKSDILSDLRASEESVREKFSRVTHVIKQIQQEYQSKYQNNVDAIHTTYITEYQELATKLNLQLRNTVALYREAQTSGNKSKVELTELQKIMVKIFKKEKEIRSEILAVEADVVSTIHWLHEESQNVSYKAVNQSKPIQNLDDIFIKLNETEQKFRDKVTPKDIYFMKPALSSSPKRGRQSFSLIRRSSSTSSQASSQSSSTASSDPIVIQKILPSVTTTVTTPGREEKKKGNIVEVAVHTPSSKSKEKSPKTYTTCRIRACEILANLEEPQHHKPTLDFPAMEEILNACQEIRGFAYDGDGVEGDVDVGDAGTEEESRPGGASVSFDDHQDDHSITGSVLSSDSSPSSLISDHFSPSRVPMTFNPISSSSSSSTSTPSRSLIHGQSSVRLPRILENSPEVEVTYGEMAFENPLNTNTNPEWEAYTQSFQTETASASVSIAHVPPLIPNRSRRGHGHHMEHHLGYYFHTMEEGFGQGDDARHPFDTSLGIVGLQLHDSDDNHSGGYFSNSDYDAPSEITTSNKSVFQGQQAPNTVVTQSSERSSQQLQLSIDSSAGNRNGNGLSDDAASNNMSMCLSLLKASEERYLAAEAKKSMIESNLYDIHAELQEAQSRLTEKLNLIEVMKVELEIAKERIVVLLDKESVWTVEKEDLYVTVAENNKLLEEKKELIRDLEGRLAESGKKEDGPCEQREQTSLLREQLKQQEELLSDQREQLKEQEELLSDQREQLKEQEELLSDQREQLKSLLSIPSSSPQTLQRDPLDVADFIARAMSDNDGGGGDGLDVDKITDSPVSSSGGSKRLNMSFALDVEDLDEQEEIRGLGLSLGLGDLVSQHDELISELNDYLRDTETSRCSEVVEESFVVEDRMLHMELKLKQSHVQLQQSEDRILELEQLLSLQEECTQATLDRMNQLEEEKSVLARRLEESNAYVTQLREQFLVYEDRVQELQQSYVKDRDIAASRDICVQTDPINVSESHLDARNETTTQSTRPSSINGTIRNIQTVYEEIVLEKEFERRVQVSKEELKAAEHRALELKVQLKIAEIRFEMQDNTIAELKNETCRLKHEIEVCHSVIDKQNNQCSKCTTGSIGSNDSYDAQGRGLEKIGITKVGKGGGSDVCSTDGEVTGSDTSEEDLGLGALTSGAIASSSSRSRRDSRNSSSMTQSAVSTLVTAALSPSPGSSPRQRRTEFSKNFPMNNGGGELQFGDSKDNKGLRHHAVGIVVKGDVVDDDDDDDVVHNIFGTKVRVYKSKCLLDSE